MATSLAPARMAAFQILRKIGHEHGNSDSLLHSGVVDALSHADRNLCTALVLGTLRWQRILDAECRRFLSHPDLPLADDAQLALRLGAYQLLFLDRIPAHAAIFESVEWVKHLEAARQAGLVNALLRKIAALSKPLNISAEVAYPEWMVARWRKFYGEDACRKICAQGQQEQPTTLRLLASDAEAELHSAGIKLKPGMFLANARYLRASENQALPARCNGQFQDEGSQLVAELLGSGARILDCCAAPGGKTAVLRQNNPEAQLLVCDSHPARLATMQRRLATFLDPSHTEFRVTDAAKLTNVGPFDRILCDVPCTGTGTLGRNPEIRHRLQPGDLPRQAERQRAILTSALRLLAPGGRLAYATCSLEPEENEAVVESCLQSAAGAGNGLTLLDLRVEFDRLEHERIAQGESAAMLRVSGFRNKYLRMLPGVHPCDGFFVALIQRDR